MASQRDGGIAWCDRTWNPVTGCTKVSAGCKHCYAELMAKRTFGRLYDVVHDGYKEGGGKVYRTRRFTDVQCHPDRLDAPLRWRKPSRVFVNSMSDLFHEAVPDEFIDRMFAVMALAPQHTFQVLTKRPARMRAYLRGAANDLRRWASAAVNVTQSPCAGHLEDSTYPLPNVWLGVSVEDQATADARIPLLLQTPAAVRFVSYEPALGPVALHEWLTHDDPLERDAVLDWVIGGGESGPKARPCDVAWIRSVVQQCKAAGVPVFVKQLGARPVLVDAAGNIGFRGLLKVWPSLPDGFYSVLNDRKGADPSEWPPDLRVREMPEGRS